MPTMEVELVILSETTQEAVLDQSDVEGFWMCRLLTELNEIQRNRQSQ